MATYAELQTQVTDRLIDSNTVVTGEVGDWVNKAIRELEDYHNFRVMERELAATTTEATRKLADLPSDWKEPRARPFLRLGESGVLGRRPMDWAPSDDWLLAEGLEIDDINDGGGTPRYLLWAQASEGDEDIFVYPLPDALSEWDDGDYRITIPYWGYMTDLSVDGDTNWFTTFAEDCIVARAVAEGFLVNWDEARAATWLQTYAKERLEILRLDKRQRVRRNRVLAYHLGSNRYAARGR